MESRDYLFKVLVIGNGHVGKTSLVDRYVNDKFNKHYKITVGGQERFTSMTRIYYKEASGCIIMFDVTDSSSFRSCSSWKEDLDSKVTLAGGSPLPCILLANKCDLSPWEVSHASIEQFSKANGFIGWMETSVKDNKNINEAISFLVEKMMVNRQDVPRPEQDGGRIQVDCPAKEANQKGCC
ncbi:ras-related protein Rab-7L1-like isoform X2 [Megalops cyprinoides]|uniref:ras-related protein Rab-7L1-like isoform X2 n=1 Tax=Megalops cyprinoides TaxID=118141 RepID=UPI0018648A58|nr:ras-related protein Rab-7L1-like isoform X2 [Megalops cyprinoides]